MSKSTPPTPPTPPSWQDSLKSALPDKHKLAAHPWLKPIAHRLLDPSLWHPRHEAVARGAAIGAFWAFAIPVGQFLFAAVHCMVWRANIPVAAGVTLITNPLTITFWLWLAYKVGNTLLGVNASAPEPGASPSGIMHWLMSYGAPAALGMGIFAVVSAALAYFTVKLAWRLRIGLRRWRRRR